MVHPRVQALVHDWVWERGNYEIQLRVVTDLVLDPNAEDFDRRLVNEVMEAVGRQRGSRTGAVRRITLTGIPNPKLKTSGPPSNK